MAEFVDGPLDGTRRLQHDLSHVLVEPTPNLTTGGAPANLKGTGSGQSMVYVLQVDSSSGKPAADESGVYRYVFRGYRHVS
ncbi:hypothetical protein ACLQ3H_16380 [Micromonospora saelicesensis]|uniref:hypothetical protein n=1 Tax=Micromonospora saelicesensis TaxID=285676 RepID=UPI003CF8CCD2